jgi:hypothetical protein
MLSQLVPFVLQRRHWYVYVIGVVPLHEPDVAVSVLPSCVEPLIVGTDWFDGADELAPLDTPATTRTVTAPAASKASRLSLLVMRNSPFQRLAGGLFPPLVENG